MSQTIFPRHRLTLKRSDAVSLCGQKLIVRKRTRRVDRVGAVSESGSGVLRVPDFSQEKIALLQNHVADLQKQLQLSNERETALESDKSKLLDLLSAEKEEKRALMPAVEAKETSRHWLLRLVGVR